MLCGRAMTSGPGKPSLHTRLRFARPVRHQSIAQGPVAASADGSIHPAVPSRQSSAAAAATADAVWLSAVGRAIEPGAAITAGSRDAPRSEVALATAHRPGSDPNQRNASQTTPTLSAWSCPQSAGSRAFPVGGAECPHPPSCSPRFISRCICRGLKPATSAAGFWLIFLSKACCIRCSRLISCGFILSRSSVSTLFSFPKSQEGRPL